MLRITLIIPFVLFALSTLPVKGYITAASSGYAKLDIDKKCDNYNTNASMSCYNIGIKGGLIDGSQHRANNLAFSAAAGCELLNSPNYCAGYFLGYSKAYGHRPNAIEFFSIANNTGANAGQAHGALPPSKILCNASTIFCNAFMHGYQLEFRSNAAYWAGYAAGGKYAESLIKMCHEEANPKIPENSPTWQKGWIEGYGDTTGSASNYNGSYGNGCQKYY